MGPSWEGTQRGEQRACRGAVGPQEQVTQEALKVQPSGEGVEMVAKVLLETRSLFCFICLL